MERWQQRAIVGLLVAILGLTTFAFGYSLGGGGSRLRGQDPSSPPGMNTVRDAYARIRSSSLDPPSRGALVRGAVKGMVRVLKRHDDPYALFYTPQGYKDFQELTTGRFSGIGVWLKEKRGRLEVVSVLPSTPAVQAGLRRGDVIRTIDQRSVAGMSIDEAVNRIKGPAGTAVSLEIERGGAPMSFEITRRSIELPNLKASVTGEDLGYIRLFGFARGAGRQLRKELSTLTDRGVEGIVLDLRDNGGGLFSEAIDVASVFIDDGRIVSYEARAQRDRVYEAAGRAYEDVPLVVLVNEGTASASEIVAGALQDRDRAILVGQKTYGKGSVQQIFPLRDASALKLTTGAYFTPSGHNLDGNGIEPDVEVVAEPKVQRERAVEILKGIVLSTSGAQG